MNSAENNFVSTAKIDASCRVPLLALFGGAAVWLVLGLLLALLASLTFHAPEMFASCPFATYGHLAPAANDLLVYGFAIPAGLGVMLWIFARLSQAELVLPLVPVVAANLWHLGVFIGLPRFCAAAVPVSPGWNFRAPARCCSAFPSFSSPFPPSPRLVSARNASCIRRTGSCSRRCCGFRGFIQRPIFSSSRCGRCVA